MHKIIVIGSNSFSGASFIQFALKKDASVVGVSRSIEANEALLPYKWINAKHFHFRQLDLNHQLNELMKLVKEFQPEYIINFAAQSMVAESWQQPKDWFITNTVSTVKLHDALRHYNKLKRYVHISTPEVYGNCSGFVKEDHPFNPSTPYAVSRAAADFSLRTFYNAYQFPVVTTRAANVYGPGQQLYRIIPRTILSVLTGKKIALHGGGHSTRSFIHIDDVVYATWKIMLDGINGETYHISNNHIISIRDLVFSICERLSVKFDDHVEIVGERLGKDASYQLDTTKLRQSLSWQDTIPLSQGIDDCILWAKKYLEVLKHQSFDYQHKP